MPNRKASWLRRGLFALATVAALVAASGGIAAQTPPSPLAALEPIKRSLDQIEASVGRGGATDEALAEQRRQLAPIRDDLRGRVEALEPQVVDAAARLKQLAAPQAVDAPPEDGSITTERIRLQQQYGELDAALKQARLMTVRADELNDRINDKRRAIFTRELLERSASALDLTFWWEAIDALPRELASLRRMLRMWWSYADATGGPRGMIAAVLALAGIAGAAVAVARWWRRKVAPPAALDARFAKAVAAMFELVRIAVTLPALALAVLLVLDGFGLAPPRIVDVGGALVAAIAVASFGHAVSTALFAPAAPGRRLLELDDETAHRLAVHLTWAARLIGAAIFVHHLHKTLVAPLSLTVATSALLAAVLTAQVFHTLIRVNHATTADGEAGPRAPWLRGVAWVAVGTVTGALVIGHIGLASFVASRTVAAVAIFGAVYVVMAFVDGLLTDAVAADTPRGRAIAAQFGLKPRSIELVGTLVSGLIRLNLVVVAGFLVFGPGRLTPADFFETLKGFAFRFEVGELTISLTAIVGAVVVLLVGLVATRGLQRWLEARFLPRTGLDPSLQMSIATIVGYVGVIAAIALAMSGLGIDLQKIALVAGALSVGIGFGLQSIVSNFVSGLILLAERPIRVGDAIVVKGEEGYVRKISVRATEIETYERASVIIPNSELITGVVKNWTHANTTGRIIVKVGVAYDSDPDEVRDILMACACDHPQLLQTPAPRVLLTGFGDSALEFELRCVVANVDYGLAVKSDLHFAILHRFRKAGIEIPFPQREVRIRGGGAPPAAG